MKISVIQDNLAAAGYLDSSFIEDIGEYNVWGQYTAAAYEQAVRDHLSECMSYSDLEYVATNQPDGDLDIRLLTALEKKASKRGDAFRKKSKRSNKNKKKKKTTNRKRKSRARKIQPKKVSPKPEPKTEKPLVKEEASVEKSSIVTDKRIV